MQSLKQLKDFLKEWGVEKYKLSLYGVRGEIVITISQDVKYYKEFLSNLQYEKTVGISYKIITKKFTRYDAMNNNKCKCDVI